MSPTSTPVLNCTEFCSILTGTTTANEPNKLISQVYLSESFSIQFLVQGMIKDGSVTTEYSLLSLRNSVVSADDSTDDSVLLDVTMDGTGGVYIYYGLNKVADNARVLVPSYNNQSTILTLTVMSDGAGKVGITYKSNQQLVASEPAIVLPVATAGNLFNLYAAYGDDAATGFVANIQLEGKFHEICVQFNCYFSYNSGEVLRMLRTF